MQKRGRALKIRIEIDGVERPGLSKFNGLKPETSEAEVNTNQISYVIKSGKKLYPAIEGEYLDLPGSGNRAFMNAWDKNNEYHDVTYIVADGHGSEVDRILLPDCECFFAHYVDYDSGSPPINAIPFKIGHYEPVEI